MGFWSGLGNIFTGSLTAGLWQPFGKKKKEDPYAALMTQLNPIIQSQQKIAEQTSKSGLANTAEARANYDYVSGVLKNILSGSDDELLKMFDSAAMTRNIDENVQQLSEQGVRGGRRAAALSQSYFDRDAAINRVLQQLRFAAPMQLAQVGQAIGNLGLGELSAASGAGAQASNIMFGIEQLKDADSDRRAQLIGSIFAAIGGTAGAIAGSR